MSEMRSTVCKLCGRSKSHGEGWLKGESRREKVTILRPRADFAWPQSTYDICGERCASEFVALWVNELIEPVTNEEKSES